MWEKYKIPIIVGTIILVVAILIYVFRKKLTTYINVTMDAFKFSPNVALHLAQLNPKYKTVFEDFIKGVINLGYEPQINSSYRDFASQAKQYAADPRNAKPGYSYHNYGLAIDMQVKKDGKTLGKDSTDAQWLASGIPQLAKTLGLTWGGDNAVFGSYQDAVHFDYRVMKTSQLLALAQQQFGNDVNNIHGNQLNIA